MSEEQNITGRKVFFLYPPLLVENQITTDLFLEEFEVYTVKDHIALKRVLKRFPNSIVFVNIDEKLKEKEWKEWISSTMNDPANSQLGIGILTTSSNEELKERYLLDVKINCGFVHTSTDTRRLLKQITDILYFSNAKGRRKFVRAMIDDDKKATLNIPYLDKFINGYIRDLSAAGFSCIFEKDPELDKDDHIPNIQIKIQGTLIRADGVVFGSREDDYMKIYVFLFTDRTDTEALARIRKHIQAIIQEQMNRELLK